MTPDEFTALRRELVRQTVSTVRARFLGLDQYRERDVAGFVRGIAPLLRAGQMTLAQLVALFLGDAATASPFARAANLVIPPPPIHLPDVVDLRPVPLEQVYRRPFVTIYTELARTGDLTAGVEKATQRLDSMIEMDMQQTHAAAMRSGMNALPPAVRPDYWRRVLQGEENCALCVLASTMRYTRDDLNPVHPGCDCRVDPIFPGGPDPVDEDALVEAAHAAARELTGVEDRGGRLVDYRKIRTNITARHGEHPAPLLVRPADHFTTEDELPD